MNPYTACATAAIVVLTVLPISRSKQWWIRALDFPRLQLFVMTAVLLVVDLLMFDKALWTSWLVPAAAAGCLAYHGWWIIPYTVLAPFEVKQAAPEDRGDILRILVSNVLMSNRDSATLIRLVRAHQPHVLVTLESDAWWQEQLDTLEGDYPFAIKCPLDNRYGMHVYSRLPLEASATEYLIQDDVPSMHTRIRLNNATQVHAHFVHPAPPAPGENEESSERDVELVTIAHRVAHDHRLRHVTGDLNDVAWSRTTRRFRRLSRLLDPRVGRSRP